MGEAKANRYIEAAFRAVSDGVISGTEQAELKRLVNALGLSGEEVGQANRLVVQQYADMYLSQGPLSENHLARLRHLCQVLQVKWNELDPAIHERLAQSMAMQSIAKGNLPIVPHNSLSVVLKQSEIVHFAAHCAIYEKKVVARASVGGTTGMRVRVAKGVSMNVGGFRGYSVPIEDFVCVSQGLLVFTSTHARYFGSKKGFQKLWKKVAGYELYQDGVALHFEDRQTPSVLKFVSGTNPAIAGAVLQRLAP